MIKALRWQTLLTSSLGGKGYFMRWQT